MLFLGCVFFCILSEVSQLAKHFPSLVYLIIALQSAPRVLKCLKVSSKLISIASLQINFITACSVFTTVLKIRITEGVSKPVAVPCHTSDTCYLNFLSWKCKPDSSTCSHPVMTVCLFRLHPPVSLTTAVLPHLSAVS